ncbi:MAG: DUF805 domain-containing protein [Gammaproteobacteria bacterium]|nr:DUF805 domain-containing protein [Gammaproteobacteria bacterium]
MNDINPYQTPERNVDTVEADEYSEIKLFSAKGRLGRLRFIAYSIGFGFLLNILVAMLGGFAAAGAGNMLISAGMVVVYLGFIAVIIMLTIQRVHDFNYSGWLALIMIIPLISLILWFVPGSQGANDYGNPAPPNSTGVVIAALIIPVIAIIGILAAIAIPAYNEYLQAAQQASAP